MRRDAQTRLGRTGNELQVSERIDSSQPRSRITPSRTSSQWCCCVEVSRDRPEPPPGHRLAHALAALGEEPKSRGWKIRARIGERKRWYELPEEAG
ncbi:MAG: hypothetical protein U0S48_08605 [Solirubrobacteraceae bacterium]